MKFPISVIIVYYNAFNKMGYLNKVFWGLERQTFKDFEVILIDNDSPISAVGIVDPDSTIDVKVIRSGINLGNCGAREKGARMARGERIIWNDGDVVYSKNFMEVHAKTDSDILISPFSAARAGSPLNASIVEIESRVREFEKNGLAPDWNKYCCQSSRLDDYVNLVPHASSLKRKIAVQNQYDPRFNYVYGKRGKGWEDIEFGCRLHKRGYKFKGDDSCWAVHIIHASASNESDFYKSWLNFKILLKLHPEIVKESSEWFERTVGVYEDNGFKL